MDVGWCHRSMRTRPSPPVLRCAESETFRCFAEPEAPRALSPESRARTRRPRPGHRSRGYAATSVRTTCSNGVCKTIECRGRVCTERSGARLPPRPPLGGTTGSSSRSRTCVNGVCTTRVCDAAGACTTTSDADGGAEGGGGAVGSPPDDPTSAEQPPASPPAVGAIVSRSRSCVNGICTSQECDAAGNCRTVSDTPPAGGSTPDDPGAPAENPAAPAISPPPATPTIGPIVSRSRSCVNGICTSQECDAQGNCQTADGEEADEESAEALTDLSPGAPEGPSPPEEPTTTVTPPVSNAIGRVVSRSRSCVNGVCTTQECDAQGVCRSIGDAPPVDTSPPEAPESVPEDPVAPSEDPEGPPDADTAPGSLTPPDVPAVGPIVSRSRSCVNGVCTTQECDAQGNCRSESDSPPGGAGPPEEPEAPPEAEPAPLEAPSTPEAIPPPDTPALGPIVSQSSSCVNGVCTTQECDAAGNCRTAVDDGTTDTPPDVPPADPPVAPAAPTEDPEPAVEDPVATIEDPVTAIENPEAPADAVAPVEVPEAPVDDPVVPVADPVAPIEEPEASIDDPADPPANPPADSPPIGPVVSRSRACANGVCSTRECDAQGTCRTVSDAPPDDTGLPANPTIPATPAPADSSPIGPIVSRSRACSNGVCATQECDAAGRCRTVSDEDSLAVSPVATIPPDVPEAAPAVPIAPVEVPTALPDDPPGPSEAATAPVAAPPPIGRIVSRGRICVNGECTTEECDAAGNCRSVDGAGGRPDRPRRVPQPRVPQRRVHDAGVRRTGQLRHGGGRPGGGRGPAGAGAGHHAELRPRQRDCQR